MFAHIDRTKVNSFCQHLLEAIVKCLLFKQITCDVLFTCNDALSALHDKIVKVITFPLNRKNICETKHHEHTRLNNRTDCTSFIRTHRHYSDLIFLLIQFSTSHSLACAQKHETSQL